MRKYYAKKLTKKQKQKEVLKIQVFILASITFLVAGYITELSSLLANDISASTEPHRTHTEEKTPDSSIAPSEQNQNTQSHTERKKFEEMTVPEKITVIAEQECKERDLGDFCVEDIKAMAYVESRFDPNRVGDNGNSYGILQIHTGYHPDVRVEQAKDLRFSIEWTLDRLVHYGYPVYRSNAIRKHNGGLDNPRTQIYLNKVNEIALK